MCNDSPTGEHEWKERQTLDAQLKRYPPYCKHCLENKKITKEIRVLEKVERARRAITEVLRSFKVVGPENRYDLEYSTARELSSITGVPCQFKGTHYWFDSPVLEEEFLAQTIEGFPPNPMIMDVGAGNGTLLHHLSELLPCSKQVGVDISAKAIQRIQEMGYRGFHGRLEEHGFSASSVDLLFLSYFVDRDEDQRGTFEESTRILRGGGRLILEGLFPCKLSDSIGVSYGKPNVTKGDSADGDVGLVVTEFGRLGLRLDDRIDGNRNVYSLDGVEILPSTILVFKNI